MMSDVDKYINSRKNTDVDFEVGFDEGYEHFKIGYLLKQARKDAGLTQDAIAEVIGTKKTAISRLENHAEDVKLSTLEKYVSALGKKLVIDIA